MPSADAVQMDPNVWGPPMWDMLFTLAFKTPQTEVEKLQTIFALLEKVIPCQHCRRSYTLYRKQVRPTISIRSGEIDSAAMWLWTIHDMVNQKLGKICIDFDKLKKRHLTFSQLTNDWSMLDLFCIMCKAVQDRPNIVEHVRSFMNVVIELSVHVPGLSISKVSRSCSESLMDDLFALHQGLCHFYKIPVSLSRDAFDDRYTCAIVTP